VTGRVVEVVVEVVVLGILAAAAATNALRFELIEDDERALIGASGVITVRLERVGWRTALEWRVGFGSGRNVDDEWKVTEPETVVEAPEVKLTTGEALDEEDGAAETTALLTAEATPKVWRFGRRGITFMVTD
jgi:hypothetical protein